MLDYRLATFLQVCRHMNFTHAAEELCITQPAVSQHIRHLETQYGVKLFAYEGKKLRLTAAGEILLSAATALQNDERAVLERMRQSGSGKQTLTFGVTLTIGEYAIAPAIARYLRQCPQTDIRVTYANTAELLACLREGELHFALVEGYFDAGNYDTMVYRTEAFIPVCAAGHRLAGGRVWELDDLLSQRLLVREPGSGTREILERSLAARNRRVADFAHLVELGSTHAIVNLLLEDCGIAFLYRTAVRQKIAEGTLAEIPLRGFPVEHDFTFLWNKGSVFSDTYRQLCHTFARAPQENS